MSRKKSCGKLSVYTVSPLPVVSNYYTPTSKKRRVYCFSSVRLSFCPFLTNHFRCTFLSNHASQSLQTLHGALARGRNGQKLNFRCTFLSNHASQLPQIWYGASARYPTLRLLNSHLPVFYIQF